MAYIVHKSNTSIYGLSHPNNNIKYFLKFISFSHLLWVENILVLSTERETAQIIPGFNQLVLLTTSEQNIYPTQNIAFQEDFIRAINCLGTLYPFIPNQYSTTVNPHTSCISVHFTINFLLFSPLLSFLGWLHALGLEYQFQQFYSYHFSWWNK